MSDASAETILEELDRLLMDHETAPTEDAASDALDFLCTWVLTHRGVLRSVLAEDQRTLASYIRLVEESDVGTYIPAAVSRRGTAYIPTPAPDGFTEAMFQELLEAEAKAAELAERPQDAARLRSDLRRRIAVFEGIARRERLNREAGMARPLALA
jgi:hypothetical protein